MNEPNGPSNGVSTDHAGNKGEFFTGHPQEGGKVNISTHEDFKKRRVIWVKKSLKDPTAALSYTLSVSILHLAMVVGLIFVKRPDIEAAKAVSKADNDSTCQLEAEDLDRILNIFIIAHCLSFFATAYREMYSAQTNLGGQMMRIIEVICIPVLFTAILSAIETVTLSLVRMFSGDAIANSKPVALKDIDTSDFSQGQLYLKTKCARDDWLKF